MSSSESKKDWVIIGGVLFALPSSNKTSKNHIKDIYLKSFVDDYYREAFLSLSYCGSIAELSRAQGWSFNRTNGRVYICSINIFMLHSSERNAIDHIKKYAETDALCALALRLVTKRRLLNTR